MGRTSDENSGRYGVNSVDVSLSKDRQLWGAGNNLQPMTAEQWYYLFRKMSDLSEKADLMTSILSSLELSFDSLCSRLEDMEVMITSVMNMQLSIANLQLDMEILEHGYLESSESTGITDAKADVRKRYGLVVEDNERAAKAAEGTDRKETTHLNGNAHRVVPTNHAPQSTFRSRFTIPRVPPTYIGHPESPSARSGSGDTVDTGVAHKTKLKSFQERKEYYHDAKYLQSEASLGSSGGPVEKDDEGERHDDNVNPLPNDMKEKSSRTSSSMYVTLPQKPQCTDLPPSLQDPLIDQYPNQLPNQSPGNEKKQYNDNKDPEAEVESNCAVDCLYYTLQCCDCSIM